MQIGTLVHLVGAPKRVGLVVSIMTMRDSFQFNRMPVYAICRVRWSDGHEDDCSEMRLKPVLCARCGYDIHAHADGEKCLYGPGHWEIE